MQPFTLVSACDSPHTGQTVASSVFDLSVFSTVITLEIASARSVASGFDQAPIISNPKGSVFRWRG